LRPQAAPRSAIWASFPIWTPVWRLDAGSRLAGLDAPPAALHEPVRLYRRRHAGAVGKRRADGACRCLEESRSRQARENAALSGMADAPIRWIVDDAQKFVAREVRRARRYDGIILDPPKYGRGPDGEVWRLEEHLAPLDCQLPPGCSTRTFALPLPHRLCRAHVGARDGRTCSQAASLPTCPARLNLENWLCARKQARAIASHRHLGALERRIRLRDSLHHEKVPPCGAATTVRRTMGSRRPYRQARPYSVHLRERLTRTGGG
jgi:hypothetical protein